MTNMVKAVRVDRLGGPEVLNSQLLAAKGSRWSTRPAMLPSIHPRPHMLAMARELFDPGLAGRIVGQPQRMLALDEAAEAHRLLESRQTIGATALLP